MGMSSTVNLLRTVGDRTRLRLLLLLDEDEVSVAELQDILGMGQSRISTHLAQLKRAGLVAPRRSGKNGYYGGSKANGQDGAGKRVREMVRGLGRDLPEASKDR